MPKQKAKVKGITVTMAELKKQMQLCFMAGITPNIIGKPGIGKSSCVHQLANQYDLIPIDIRLSTYDPVDMNGALRVPAPRADKEGNLLPLAPCDLARFVPFDNFPIEGLHQVPKGKNGWIVFLDEFNSAPDAVQAAAYKLVLDWMVGGYKLHPNVYLVAAGNGINDGAIVNRTGTAMQSRMTHYTLEVPAKEWLDNYAIGAGIDHRIQAYIGHAPHQLHVFDPKHNDLTFACHRTWEHTSRLIKNTKTEELHTILATIAGTIGEGVARQFITHVKIYQRLPTYHEIIADPTNARLDRDPAMLFGVANMIGAYMTRKDAKAAMQYITRMSVEFQTIALQNAARRDKTIAADSEVIKWMTNTGRKLFA